MAEDKVRLDTAEGVSLLKFREKGYLESSPKKDRAYLLESLSEIYNNAIRVVTKSDEGPSFFRRAQSAEYTNHGTVIDLALHWMSICVSQHESCVSNLQPSKYPTRLLEIMKDIIYLIDCRESEVSGPYATLSHCWGQRPFRALIDENIEEFRAGVALSDFLPTFRDAMTAVRLLNIRYIWIDCFCIIQSNGADKKRELASMGDVYASAAVNIGTVSSSSPFDGCFANRPRVTSFGACIRARLKAGTRSYHFFRNLDGQHAALRDREEFYKDTLTFDRAWCLQERLLCPRMLHLGKTRVYWECKQWPPLTENFPYGYTGLP